MQIHIIAAGTKMPQWVTGAYTDYQQRFPNEYKIILKSIDAEKKNAEQLFLSAIPERSHVIALDPNGSQWDNDKLAKQLIHWRQEHPVLCFLIGGADGLPKSCMEKSHQRWCLSPLIFPHGLVRIILIEQLWRAASMLMDHPYHRGKNL